MACPKKHNFEIWLFFWGKKPRWHTKAVVRLDLKILSQEKHMLEQKDFIHSNGTLVWQLFWTLLVLPRLFIAFDSGTKKEGIEALQI